MNEGEMSLPILSPILSLNFTTGMGQGMHCKHRRVALTQLSFSFNTKGCAYMYKQINYIA